MSRLGRLPIIIPAGIDVMIEGGQVVISGPKGRLTLSIPTAVRVARVEALPEASGPALVVSVADEHNRRQRALWGLFRVLMYNMVTGVTSGFSKQLEINGVGYRASVSGKDLTLNVGYSHPVIFSLPDGISASVDKNVITIAGIDKQLVGEVAAQIRRIRKPEPYKGKGIKYISEVIRRKAGKTAASTK